MTAPERTAAAMLREMDAAIQRSLNLIGEGDWTPQDTLLAKVPLPELAALVEAAERHVRADVWVEGEPLRGKPLIGPANGTTASEEIGQALARLTTRLAAEKPDA